MLRDEQIRQKSEKGQTRGGTKEKNEKGRREVMKEAGEGWMMCGVSYISPKTFPLPGHFP